MHRKFKTQTHQDITQNIKMSHTTKPRFCIVSPSEIRSIQAAEFSQPPQGRDRKFPREGEITISVWRDLMLNDFLGITPQYIEAV